MSIQYILGSSGSGKSHYLYQNIIEASMVNPHKNYFIIVPEQFTMSTQQKVIKMHPRHGIMNVDILSFPRLAYRIFAETGVRPQEVLDDTGKSLVLRKVMENHRDELRYFAGNVNKAGFVEEIKSVISEFLQYSVTADQLGILRDNMNDNPILRHKLLDIEILYRGFTEYIHQKYIASEELLEVLCKVVGSSALIRDSVVVLDGFTGFTPIQYRLIGLLMEICSEIKVAVTISSKEKPNVLDGMENLFHLSKQTMARLNSLADGTRTPVMPAIHMDDEVPYRLRGAAPLVFMEKNIFRNNRAVYSEDTGRFLKIYEGVSPKNEIDYIVGEIKRLVLQEKYHYGDMAIVSADMDRYGYLAANIMEQNDIPCFVDYKRNIMGNVLVEFIRSALEVVEKDFSYESVFRLLKTGLSGIRRDDMDQLENYVLALGIRGYSSWNKRWIRNYADGNEKTITIEQLDSIRLWVVELLSEFRIAVKESSTIRDYCTALYALMVKVNLQEKASAYADRFEAEQELSLSGEYRQCYAKIIELFDKMVELLGDEKVSFQEFGDILDAGFGEIKVGLIPQKKDSVMIGDIERTRLDNIKILFFIGVNDGNIPKNGDKGGVLSPVDREAMAEKNVVLSPNERENAFIQRFYLYLALTKASDRLYLSYSRLGTDGKALRVSYLIGAICNMFPSIRIMDEKSAAGILRTVKIPSALFQWSGVEQSGISSLNALKLYGEDIAKSASRIEQFYNCAFAHFVSYGLRLQERAVYSVNSADIGTLFHDTLEKVSQKIIKGGKGFTEIDDMERRNLVEEAVLEAATDYNNSVLFDSERSRYFVKRLTDMTEITVWAIGQQLRHGRFMPKHFEKSFKTENNIVGRIDRIDTYEQDDSIYVKVVDYKTGSSDFDLNDAYYGLKLQLITYMQAAGQIEKQLHPDKNIVTAGLFYYNIKTPFAQDDSSQEAIDRQLLEELRMKGIVNAGNEVLAALENDPSGKSIAIPVSYNKDGSVREGSGTLQEEQLQWLSAHAKKLIRYAEERMEEGCTKVHPYRRGDRTGCDYCPYDAVCGFDAKLSGNAFRNIREYSEDELWEKLGEENGKHMD